MTRESTTVYTNYKQSLIVLLLTFLPFFIFGQSIVQDSLSKTLWNPLQYQGLRYQQSILSDSLNPEIHLSQPKGTFTPKYYDPKNVIPADPLKLDYRHHSYYTPKMVTDFLDHAMNRPRRDSFVPIPSLAFLAASIALQYVNLEQTLIIEAKDYNLEEQYLDIMTQLWIMSPQTADEIYKRNGMQQSRTFKVLEYQLKKLVDDNLVKIKEIEKSQPQYFAAQTSNQVKTLLKNALDNQLLNYQTRSKFNQLIKILNDIN